jgi:hypothetical protein
MPYAVTYRNEDGRWFATLITEGRVQCWSDDRKEAIQYNDIAEPSAIVAATNLWRKDNPCDEIRGTVRVIEF